MALDKETIEKIKKMDSKDQDEIITEIFKQRRNPSVGSACSSSKIIN